MSRKPVVESAINAEQTLLHSYPKHVWSPAGGWYTQPANWKQNTAIMGAVMTGITLMAWSVSADREHRDKMPEVWSNLVGGKELGKQESNADVRAARPILPFEVVEPRDQRIRAGAEGAVVSMIVYMVQLEEFARAKELRNGSSVRKRRQRQKNTSRNTAQRLDSRAMSCPTYSQPPRPTDTAETALFYCLC